MPAWVHCRLTSNRIRQLTLLLFPCGLPDPRGISWQRVGRDCARRRFDLSRHPQAWGDSIAQANPSLDFPPDVGDCVTEFTVKLAILA